MKDSDPVVRRFAENALWGIWFRSDSPANNEELTAVRNLLSEERFEEAMTRVNALIAKAPQFAEAWNQRAILHFTRGDLQKSVDDCRDVVRYWDVLNEGYDCVFGSRFMRGGGVIDYPWIKLLLNRTFNFFIRILFGIKLNDTTNAFKAYRRSVIKGINPILSQHFNLTVELPLKAIVRGYSWTVIPITWRNRRFGVAKLKIAEMGSRYLFICLYVWLEKTLSRGDYRKPNPEQASAAQSPAS
jgi:hypothetical protein